MDGDGEKMDMEVINDDEIEESDEENENEDQEVYLPNRKLQDDEELVCDESAYIMLHSASTGAPCLSFDIIKDQWGVRETFPMSLSLVCGTQASASHVNNVIVMKMSNLHRTSKEKEEDSDLESDLSDDEDDVEEKEEKKPQMSCALINHVGCVNRIRSTTVDSQTFAASFSETGKVFIFNITEQLKAVNDHEALKLYENTNQCALVKPLFVFRGHRTEGYGIDWSTKEPGVLATGDCNKDIHIWRPAEASWIVNQVPLVGHTGSVEDIQFSPNEANVMATCSADKSIRIWDTRAAPHKACMLTADNAHDNDVNVISWNKSEPFIASGCDDGILKVWDLRHFQNKTPIATFKHHTDHITTVEWNPLDSTVLATGGDDDQIAIFDLSIEKDDGTENDPQLKEVPPQLLFIHQGQKEIKELHWHPQLPGVMLSTALSGFNVFKTISV